MNDRKMGGQMDYEIARRRPRVDGAQAGQKEMSYLTANIAVAGE
jgi:hypothetical protein